MLSEPCQAGPGNPGQPCQKGFFEIFWLFLIVKMADYAIYKSAGSYCFLQFFSERLSAGCPAVRPLPALPTAVRLPEMGSVLRDIDDARAENAARLLRKANP